MRHERFVHVGPARFRLGSAWPLPLRQIDALYADYPREPGIPDFSVRLEPAGPLRRLIRPSVAILGDFTLPDAAPLPLAQALLAAEMAMNLQMALGWRRHMLLHASAVERDGRALVMTGESGSGKSTLAALLGERGWRFMGDEFVLLDPDSGACVPFPRAISLKNQAIQAMEAVCPPDRFGPLLARTPKGDVRHLKPRPDAIARMAEPAMPRLLLFPRFGFAAETRPVGEAETFVRLTQASTNYVRLGERGFVALTNFVGTVPGIALDYPDGDTAVDMVERLWRDAL